MCLCELDWTTKYWVPSVLSMDRRLTACVYLHFSFFVFVSTAVALSRQRSEWLRSALCIRVSQPPSSARSFCCSSFSLLVSSFLGFGFAVSVLDSSLSLSLSLFFAALLFLPLRYFECCVCLVSSRILARRRSLFPLLSFPHRGRSGDCCGCLTHPACVAPFPSFFFQRRIIVIVGSHPDLCFCPGCRRCLLLWTENRKERESFVSPFASSGVAWAFLSARSTFRWFVLSCLVQ